MLSLARKFGAREWAVVTAVGVAFSAWSWPLVSALRSRDHVEAMENTLRNLAAQQESYLYDHATYAGRAVLLGAFDANQNVNVVMREATRAGWSATASHQKSLTECHLFVGSAAPVGPADQMGVPTCG